MAKLRCLTWIDRLQPLTAGFLGTVCVGDPPLVGDAALLIEVSPGLAVEGLLDAALKRTRCVPGLFVVERQYGVLQLHHRSQGEVREAGVAVLEALEADEASALPPRVVTAERITGVDPHHAQIVNRFRHGDELSPGETLYVFETEPAGYALLAANEAEKAAGIRILEVRAFGAFGRVYIAGDDASVGLAVDAMTAALA